MRRIVVLLALALFLGGITMTTGCEMFKGLGKDTENLGKNMQGD